MAQQTERSLHETVIASHLRQSSEARGGRSPGLDIPVRAGRAPPSDSFPAAVSMGTCLLLGRHLSGSRHGGGELRMQIRRLRLFQTLDVWIRRPIRRGGTGAVTDDLVDAQPGVTVLPAPEPL